MKLKKYYIHLGVSLSILTGTLYYYVGQQKDEFAKCFEAITCNNVKPITEAQQNSYNNILKVFNSSDYRNNLLKFLKKEKNLLPQQVFLLNQFTLYLINNIDNFSYQEALEINTIIKEHSKKLLIDYEKEKNQTNNVSNFIFNTTDYIYHNSDFSHFNAKILKKSEKLQNILEQGEGKYKSLNNFAKEYNRALLPVLTDKVLTDSLKDTFITQEHCEFFPVVDERADPQLFCNQVGKTFEFYFEVRKTQISKQKVKNN